MKTQINYILQTRLKRGACLAYEQWSDTYSNKSLVEVKRYLAERKEWDVRDKCKNTLYRLIKQIILTEEIK